MSSLGKQKKYIHNQISYILNSGKLNKKIENYNNHKKKIKYVDLR